MQSAYVRKGRYFQLKNRIPELRKQRRISQEELAKAVDVSRQTITSIEVGKYVASLPLAWKISRYFGLKIEDVFIFTEESKEKKEIEP